MIEKVLERFEWAIRVWLLKKQVGQTKKIKNSELFDLSDLLFYFSKSKKKFGFARFLAPISPPKIGSPQTLFR